MTSSAIGAIIHILSTTQGVYNMTFGEQLLEIISDPYEGPFEGEDYFIDVDGVIHVPVDNIKLAALVMRKVNATGMFEQKLVKIGQGGDSVLLGFDTLVDADPVYVVRVGYKKDTLAEVKKDTGGKFALYLNKQRTARLFKKLTSVKLFLKKLDKELTQDPIEPEVFDD